MVLIDLAGHGHSGFNRQQYTMHAFGEDVKAVIEATKSQKVVLIGHSMGGKTLMHLSQIAPQRIKKMIVADIGPKAYPPHHDTILEAFESVDLEKVGISVELIDVQTLLPFDLEYLNRDLCNASLQCFYINIFIYLEKCL